MCFLHKLSPSNSITFDAHWPGRTPSKYSLLTQASYLSLKNSTRTETNASMWLYYRPSTAKTIIIEYQIISFTPKYRNAAVKRGKGTVHV